MRPLKILLLTHAFSPAIGGIETMSALLAEGFTRRGHTVTVVTQTPSAGSSTTPYQVLRAPSPRQLLSAFRACDVVFHNNISLQTLWPLVFVRRPWVVAHHTWIRRVDGSLGWQDRLKRFVLRYSSGIAVSRAIAEDVPAPCEVIPNPYDDAVFKVLPENRRDRDLVFLGRLVSDKGADLLLDAIARLKHRGQHLTATFIGTGPESTSLQAAVESLGLQQDVVFAGALTGQALVAELNRHRVLVVPSRCREAFGLVALEGMACGCVVVGSEGGGLPDAIGPAGRTFPNGDVEALTEVLFGLLTNPDSMRALQARAPEHLRAHAVERAVDRYLSVLGLAVAGGKA